MQKRPPHPDPHQSSKQQPHGDLVPKTENKSSEENDVTTTAKNDVTTAVENDVTIAVVKLDHVSDSEQDEADGNAMSGIKKEVRFKDILSAKLAKGPR